MSKPLTIVSYELLNWELHGAPVKLRLSDGSEALVSAETGHGYWQRIVAAASDLGITCTADDFGVSELVMDC